MERSGVCLHAGCRDHHTGGSAVHLTRGQKTAAQLVGSGDQSVIRTRGDAETPSESQCLAVPGDVLHGSDDSHCYQLRQIPCKNTVAGGQSSAGRHDAITVPRDCHSCPAALGYIATAATARYYATGLMRAPQQAWPIPELNICGRTASDPEVHALYTPSALYKCVQTRTRHCRHTCAEPNTCLPRARKRACKLRNDDWFAKILDNEHGRLTGSTLGV